MAKEVSPLRFNGQVAIITGAARGLGREYALLLASRGASVVINDLGGGRDGTGKSAAADSVVQEITKLGGTAIADYHSVENGDKIVQTALDKFGRIDILINNAGILRDKSMMKITEEDWDLVHRVHLKGSFMVTKAAWPYFREQNYGRIVMTSSPSGIYGNFGQVNYSSAKLGILSLAKTLAVEGDKYNIKCNTIVPVAASRLTEDLLPEDIFDLFKPQYVAPIVAFLSHENCPVNGQVFEAAGGFYGKYRWQRSKGKVFPDASKVTIENISQHWEEISDLTNYSSPNTMQEHTLELIKQLTPGSDDSDEELIEDHTTTNENEELKSVFKYSHDDSVLYALSIGVSTNEKSHQTYLYEGDEKFAAFPTYATSIALNAIYDTYIFQEAVTKYNLEDNLIKTLHGEQYLKVYEPIPTSGTLVSIPKIIDVLDKGSGALIITEVSTYDQRGTLLFYNQLSFFMVGSGNFGGKRSSDNDKIVNCVEPPNRSPDAVICQQTTAEQAALFRLCGDKNPLHIDPNFSIIGGFEKPILHGLCMLGFAVRHALRQFAHYDGSFFDATKARFVGAFIPGQTIETRLWNSSSGDLTRIHFECFIKETGNKIVSSAFVDLKQPPTGIRSSLDHYSVQTGADCGTGLSLKMKQSPVADHNIDEGFDDIEDISCAAGIADASNIDDLFSGWLMQKIRENPEIVSLVNTTYQFNVTENGKQCAIWTLDLKNEKGNVFKGIIQNGKPDCTLTVDQKILMNIFRGKEDALQAFMSGKLKVSGNILAAQKLQQIWAENSSSDALQNSEISSPENQESDKTLLESIPVSGLKCDLIFTILRNRMHEEPDVIRKLRASYQFNITSGGRFVTTWTAENKSDPNGSVYNAPFKNGKADCIATVEDDDFVKLMFGKLNPQRAFMLGKLKVKGNIMLLQRLNSIWIELQKNGKTPELPYLIELISKTNLIPGIRSEMMVIELIQRLIRLPYLVTEIATCVGFEIVKDGKTAVEYSLNFTKNKETGIFDRGLPAEGHCVLTMSDEDFVRLTYHKLTLEEGIKVGKIKVRGDKNISNKISIIFKTPTSRVRL